MIGEAGRLEGGAQVDVAGWAPRRWCPGGCGRMGAQEVVPRWMFLWFKLVRCFRLILAYGFNCFKFQGCSGVLIMIKFGFNFNWGFLVIR